jgi:hypothetical protein
VEGQIASNEWTRSAHFGQFDTTAGTHFRAYVLSTPTELPIGELMKQPEQPREWAAITATLETVGNLYRRSALPNSTFACAQAFSFNK